MLQSATRAPVRQNFDDNFWVSRHRAFGLEADTMTETVAVLLERLVHADLKASAYRVALDTLARLLRQERTTEAMPVQAMADRLGLHRNAIGAGYVALERVGIMRRVVVSARGAPTRTHLAGPALSLANKLQVIRSLTAAQGHTEREGKPWSAGKEHLRSETYFAFSPPAANDCKPAEGAGLSFPDAVAVAMAEAPTHVEPNPTEGPLTTPARTASVAEPAPPFKFDAAVNESLKGKIGYDNLYRVMSHTPGLPFEVDAAWQLSDDECAHLKALLPKPEILRPTAAKAKPVATLAIVRAAAASMPRLSQKFGAGRASYIVDEIAFMVMKKNLGYGDHAGGMRAGVSIALKGTWSRPKDYTEDWTGAVLRGSLGSHNSEGDAPETVH